MPVTKSAKRALRGSIKKGQVNTNIVTRLEKAVRSAKKTKTQKSITEAMSLADRAAKSNAIHKNKAARIKSTLSKLAKPEAKTKKPATPKKASTKKASVSKKK